MAGESYIFAGGGTGGHLYPALAVADELRRLDPEATILFACSSREIDRAVLQPTGYEAIPQPVRPLPSPRRPWQVPAFLRAWVASRRIAADLIARRNVQAVLGMGGFAAGPAIAAAARASVPAALLNPDAVPGKANRFLAPKVAKIFTQFESTTALFPSQVQENVQVTGCPVRESLLDGDRAEAAELFGLEAERKTLLVLGGSLGAASVSDAVAALAGEFGPLKETWQILHIAGAGKQGQLSDVYAAAGVPAGVIEYCDRMDLAYAIADFAVCRAGASTVAEIAATATPCLFMPYPYHRDQHQKLNAAALAGSGAAIVVDDLKSAQANLPALRQTLLTVLCSPSRLDEMAAAARTARKPHAARTIAQWLATAAENAG